MNVIEKLVGGDARVAEEALVTQPIVAQAAKDRLVQEIQHFGRENLGVSIRYESVHIVEHRDPERHFVIFRGVWCPLSSKGVEFYGGPLDGKIMCVSEDAASRMAPIEIRIPGLPSSAILESEPQLAPVPTIHHAYERWGINGTWDRWVYRYKGER